MELNIENTDYESLDSVIKFIIDEIKKIVSDNTNYILDVYEKERKRI